MTPGGGWTLLGLWIALIVLTALVLLFWRLRLGVRMTFGPGGASAEVKAGPLCVRLAPRPERAAAKKTEKTGKTEKSGRDLSAAAKRFPRPTAADLKDAWRTLGPPARRALERTRRSVRLAPLRLSVTVGGAEEPADAAELYGLLNALVWTGMPALERLVDVPDPQIHTGIDFDAPQTRAEGELGLSIRLGTLIAVGLTLGLPALKWLRSYCKRHGPRQTAPRAAEHPAA